MTPTRLIHLLCFVSALISLSCVGAAAINEHRPVGEPAIGGQSSQEEAFSIGINVRTPRATTIYPFLMTVHSKPVYEVSVLFRPSSRVGYRGVSILDLSISEDDQPSDQLLHRKDVYAEVDPEYGEVDTVIAEDIACSGKSFTVKATVQLHREDGSKVRFRYLHGYDRHRRYFLFPATIYSIARGLRR